MLFIPAFQQRYNINGCTYRLQYQAKQVRYIHWPHLLSKRGASRRNRQAPSYRHHKPQPWYAGAIFFLSVMIACRKPAVNTVFSCYSIFFLLCANDAGLREFRLNFRVFVVF
jgi:hypothetical protein